MHNCDGKAKISMGNNKNKAGKCLNSELSGETRFLGGSSFNLGGNVSAGSLQGGGVLQFFSQCSPACFIILLVVVL